MTNIIDIYEACGATVNEDRTEVSFSSTGLKPCKIVLEVIPMGQEDFGDGSPSVMTFGVILDSETVIGKTDPIRGTRYWEVKYDESVRLPVTQVELHNNLINQILDEKVLEDWCTSVKHGGDSVDAILREDLPEFLEAAMREK